MDYFPFLLYFPLSYLKGTSQSIASRWVQNTVSRFGNSSPKGSTGWWLDWLAKATEPLETVSLRSLKAAWGFRMSADVSLSIWKVPWLPECSFIWLGYYIPYHINTRLHLPNRSSYLTHLDICPFSNREYPFELICSPYALFEYYMPIHSIIFIVPIIQAWLVSALSN